MTTQQVVPTHDERSPYIAELSVYLLKVLSRAESLKDHVDTDTGQAECIRFCLGNHQPWSL